MLLFNRVTLGAGQGGMMGNSFIAGDFTVTGAAITLLVRQAGIMRIMAGQAGTPRIVEFGNNLRESRGSRGIKAVAMSTMLSLTRYYRRIFVRFLGMIFRRTVTGFAGNAPMHGTCLFVKNIIMAFVADLKPGIYQFDCHILIDGTGSIMADLTKGIGNQKVAGN